MAWRLLAEEGDASGPFNSGLFNMGVDEAMLSTAIASGLPTLRFYGWDGPWLSVGYAQPFDARQQRPLREAGVGFVRRATGGRAVLHGADLTYSIAAPEGVLPDGVRESYGAVADALLRALGDLGVRAYRSDPQSQAPGQGVFDCFARPAADEICVGGKKLSGSAQRRVGGALLQHGSIRIGPDPVDAVSAVAPGRRGLGGTSLLESGFSVSRPELQAACLRAFEDLLGDRFEPGELTPQESRIARLRGPEPASQSHLRDASEPLVPLNS